MIASAFVQNAVVNWSRKKTSNLSAVLNRFWINLQIRYNMKIAKSKLEKKTEKDAKVHFYESNGQNLATA